MIQKVKRRRPGTETVDKSEERPELETSDSAPVAALLKDRISFYDEVKFQSEEIDELNGSIEQSRNSILQAELRRNSARASIHEIEKALGKLDYEPLPLFNNTKPALWKPTICVDFDAVIHKYDSAWQGADVIPDEPVPGAFEWLLNMLDQSDVDKIPMPVIYSSRSKDQLGIKAMKEWFMIHGFPPEALEKLEFPTQKPAAFLTIDDRAFCFIGKFPTISEMMGFKPWNKK